MSSQAEQYYPRLVLQILVLTQNQQNAPLSLFFHPEIAVPDNMPNIQVHLSVMNVNILFCFPNFQVIKEQEENRENLVSAKEERKDLLARQVTTNLSLTVFIPIMLVSSNLEPIMVPLFQVQPVCPVMVKTEAPDKPEPRESQETPAPTVRLDLQVLLANVTPASVPTMPAWHTDPTPKMSRGLKERKGTESLKSSCIYDELGLNQELFFFKITSVWRAEATCAAGQILCFVYFLVRSLGWMGIKHRGTFFLSK